MQDYTIRPHTDSHKTLQNYGLLLDKTKWRE